jgi:hypothetical protein
MPELSLMERIKQNAEQEGVKNQGFRDAIRITRGAPRPAEKEMSRVISDSVAPIDAAQVSALLVEHTRRDEAVEKFALETSPRETVYKFLANKKLDEPFLFNVQKGDGENYAQAMRQVLSRARAKALKKKIPLDEFKVLTLKIENLENYDEVTLIRTKTLSTKEESVYDDLIAQFTKKMPEPAATPQQK